MTLAAPWEVSFDPQWRGPAKAVFASLQDWTQRLEPGIKYYSGKAVYRTTFDCITNAAKGRWFLNLGSVKNLASVKLNGRDLGIAWCEPWRTEIPGDVLRQSNNVLEITVANLWINRLIGDSRLPPQERRTWTTYQPFRPDSPLQPSGLFGPVSLNKSGGGDRSVYSISRQKRRAPLFRCRADDQRDPGFGHRPLQVDSQSRGDQVVGHALVNLLGLELRDRAIRGDRDANRFFSFAHQKFIARQRLP